MHMLCEVYMADGSWKEAHELLTAQQGSEPIAALPPELAGKLACCALRLGSAALQMEGMRAGRQKWSDSDLASDGCEKNVGNFMRED